MTTFRYPELRTAFWQRAAQSLPPVVRRRYVTELERAERIDLVIAALVQSWRRVQRALMRRSAAELSR